MGSLLFSDGRGMRHQYAADAVVNAADAVVNSDDE